MRKNYHQDWMDWPGEVTLDKALELIRLNRIKYIDYDWRLYSYDNQLSFKGINP